MVLPPLHLSSSRNVEEKPVAELSQPSRACVRPKL